MVFIDDKNRMKADLDGYGKQTISKKKFEEIVKEEKEMGGLISRAQLKKMYNVKNSKERVSKKRFEEIVKEEKGIFSRAQLKKMYTIKC